MENSSRYLQLLMHLSSSSRLLKCSSMLMMASKADEEDESSGQKIHTVFTLEYCVMGQIMYHPNFEFNLFQNDVSLWCRYIYFVQNTYNTTISK